MSAHKKGYILLAICLLGGVCISTGILVIQLFIYINIARAIGVLFASAIYISAFTGLLMWGDSRNNFLFIHIYKNKKNISWARFVVFAQVFMPILFILEGYVLLFVFFIMLSVHAGCALYEQAVKLSISR